MEKQTNKNYKNIIQLYLMLFQESKWFTSPNLIKLSFSPKCLMFAEGMLILDYFNIHFLKLSHFFIASTNSIGEFSIHSLKYFISSWMSWTHLAKGQRMLIHLQQILSMLGWGNSDRFININKNKWCIQAVVIKY